MRSHVAVALLSLVLGAMGAICAGWAIVSLGRAEYPTVIVVTGFAVLSFAMVAMMANYAIFAPLDMVDIAVPRGDRKYLVFTAIAGVLLGLPSLRQMLTKHGMSYLTLSAEGVETGNTTSSVYRGRPRIACVCASLLGTSRTPWGTDRRAGRGTTRCRTMKKRGSPA